MGRLGLREGFVKRSIHAQAQLIEIRSGEHLMRGVLYCGSLVVMPVLRRHQLGSKTVAQPLSVAALGP